MNFMIVPSILLVAVALSISCSTQATTSRMDPEEPSARSQTIIDTGLTITEPPAASTPVSTSIKNSKGLIVLSEKYGKDDAIRIYNDDGSIWYEFTFYYEARGEKFNEIPDFAPFAFHADYFTLALKCVGEEKDRYEVVVNEESGLRKFVKKAERSLRFQDWEQHVMKAFSVGFDSKSNPLHAEPGKPAQNVELPEDTTFHPVEIKGQWLKVRWESEGVTDSGWIKWKGDDQLFVELFYFA
jgi:hypothetical protein